MFIFEKQFRRDKPENIGETDSIFDLDNYKNWLEEKLQNCIDTMEEVAEELDKKEMNINSFEFLLWSRLNFSLSKVL